MTNDERESLPKKEEAPYVFSPARREDIEAAVFASVQRLGRAQTAQQGASRVADVMLSEFVVLKKYYGDGRDEQW